MASTIPPTLTTGFYSVSILHPDQQVQQSVRTLFQSFRRLGSAGAVVKAFRDAKLLFPHRPRGGPQDGELLWLKLGITQVLFVLHASRRRLRVWAHSRTQDAARNPARASTAG
jgi:hypothetical protein